jgi:hypothetical protein
MRSADVIRSAGQPAEDGCITVIWKNVAMLGQLNLLIITRFPENPGPYVQNA